MCSSALARQIYEEINAISTSTLQTNLRAYFKKVEDACTAAIPNPAVDEAIDFYTYFLRNWGAYNETNVETAAASLVTDVARFIGETSTIAPGAFTQDGGIGTFDNGIVTSAITTETSRRSEQVACDPAFCELKATSNQAGLRLLTGLQLSTGELYAIVKVPTTDCRRENLERAPQCYDVTVVSNRYPVATANPAGKRIYPSPGLQVATCAVNHIFENHGRIVLAHPEPNTSSTSTLVELARAAVNLPTLDCSKAVAFVAPQNAAPSQFALAFGRAALLASRLAAFLGPRTANAGDGGGTAGGSFSSLTPIGPLDPQVLRGTWNQLAPANLGLQLPSPYTERGTWTNSVFRSGSITVEDSVGDLKDVPLVISQGGGACDNCDSLNLTGTFRTNDDVTYAAHGTYVVSWWSLEHTPNVQYAPIDVRDSGDKVVARLAYKSVLSAKVLEFNGEDLPVPWVVDKKQRFDITIRLDDDPTTAADERTVQLTITTPGASPSVVVRPARRFLDPSAANIHKFVIRLGYIDSGVIGLDDVTSTRTP